MTVVRAWHYQIKMLGKPELIKRKRDNFNNHFYNFNLSLIKADKNKFLREGSLCLKKGCP